VLEHFVKDCSPWEGLMVEKSMEDCLPGRDPMLEQHNRARRKKQQTTCDELTAVPIPCPPCVTQREEVEKMGVKLSLGRREGWGKDVLRFVVFFFLVTIL